MTPNIPSDRPRLLVMGDSIANGLGVRERRYSQLIADQLDMDLVDISRSGATVADTLHQINTSMPAVDIAIVAHGITEPIVRPASRALRYLPKRWQRRGWMDPRPYYSRRLRKRIFERAESATRWRVKVVLLRRPKNRSQLMDCDQYVNSMLKLIRAFDAHSVPVLVIGAPSIDEVYFPGSASAQSQYEQSLVERGVRVINVSNALTRWEDYFLDHFHPNVKGHQKMAKTIAPIVRAQLLKEPNLGNAN